MITGTEPEFSVSRGLAWSGRIDEELRQFRAEIQDLVGSSTVERIVANHIDELYHSTVDMLVKPILENAAMPVFDRWRDGEIERLSDINAEMEKEIEKYLHTEEVQEMLIRPITQWLKPVSYELEEMTMPICIRHGVPYRALSLSSFLSISDLKRRRADLGRNIRRNSRSHDLAYGPRSRQGQDGGGRDEHGDPPSYQKTRAQGLLYVPDREDQR